jgi:hypothetical protein
MNKIQKDLRLLPNSWRKYIYAFGLFVILIFFLSIMHWLPIEKSILKELFMDGLLISLLLLVLSQDKKEDEFSMNIRLKAFAASFIYGAVYTITYPFLTFLLDGKFGAEKGAKEIFLSMLLFYILIFIWMKRKR